MQDHLDRARRWSGFRKALATSAVAVATMAASSAANALDVSTVLKLTNVIGNPPLALSPLGPLSKVTIGGNPNCYSFIPSTGHAGARGWYGMGISTPNMGPGNGLPHTAFVSHSTGLTEATNGPLKVEGFIGNTATGPQSFCLSPTSDIKTLWYQVFYDLANDLPKPALSGATGGIPVGGIYGWSDLAAAATPVAPGRVIQYTMPTAASGPCNLVQGPDGEMWISEVLAHKLARIDSSTGKVEEFTIPNTLTVPAQPLLPLYGVPGLKLLNALLQSLSGAALPLPYPASFQCGINNGPDNRIWFTNAVSNLIGNIDVTTHIITTYPVPTLGSNVEDIVAGPDNAMWFVEPTASKIGRFDLATGAITEYQVPNPLAAPIGIFAASDGGIWFPEFVGNKIGRIDVVSKVITEYPVPTPLSTPFVLRVETPDGSLWFSEFTGNKIGRISMATGKITEYTVPTPLAGPVSVTLGTDGNIYTDLSLVNKIAKLDPATGIFTERAIPVLPGAFTEEIRFGAANEIWFTELVTNQVGRMTPF